MESREIASFFCYSPITATISPLVKKLSEKDVAHLFEVSKDHNLEYLLFIGLRDNDMLSYLPEETILRFQIQHQEHLYILNSQIEELNLIYKSFKAQGIELLLLKEYAFDTTFPAPGCVMQSDFDLLIHPEDLPGAMKVMEHLEYCRVPRKWNNEYRYKQQGKKSVDLHVSFNSQFNWLIETEEDISNAFNTSDRLNFKDWDIPVLGTEQNAVFLLLHTVLHHNFVPFSKIVSYWNFLIAHRQKIDPIGMQDRLNLCGIGNLLDFSHYYIESVIGYSFLEPVSIKVLPRIEKYLFQILMPHPDQYFKSASILKLKRSSMNGFQHVLFCNKWGMKMNCLHSILSSLVKNIFERQSMLCMLFTIGSLVLFKN